MEAIFNPEHFEPEAVIFGNGSFPKTDVIRQWLKGNPFLVALDGAANRMSRRGLEPQLIVGDGDSILPSVRRKWADRFVHVSEQEDNDQTKAVRILLERGFRKLVILGGTGRREDHTIGNVSLLMDYLELGVTALMPTDYGLFVPCQDNMRFVARQGQEISIFRFDAAGLKAQGLEYPLRDFTELWQGTLNKAVRNEIHIEAQGRYLVYFAR